jgi:arabinan endo-1,5-alpha-L-arabinosidase
MLNRRTFLSLAGAAIAAAPDHSPAQHSRAYQLATGCPIADPFCVKLRDAWYVVGTQHTRGVEDRRFTLFRSTDLRAWEDLGPVLVRPDYEGSTRANYWAPEFAERGGRYYFYYTSDSFGNPERRFVRVAVADSVRGPYVDSGKPLVDKPSIDGHPYFPAGEQAQLFYCGNEGNPHVGQLLVDGLLDPLTMEHKPRKVFPDETVEWEEGPFVIRHADSYFLFSSMGNWRDGSYHIRVARSKKITGPWERLRRKGEPYRLLVTREGQWGPGHNSVFTGPDGNWWICYHAWDKARTGRYPWVSPLRWEGDGFPVAG